MLDRRVTLERLGQLEMLRRVILAKIRRLEQLLNQDHVRTARRGLPDQFLGASHIGVAVPTARHLRCGYGNQAHQMYATSRDGVRTWVANWRSPARTLRVRDCEIDAEWNS